MWKSSTFSYPEGQCSTISKPATIVHISYATQEYVCISSLNITFIYKSDCSSLYADLNGLHEECIERKGHSEQHQLLYDKFSERIKFCLNVGDRFLLQVQGLLDKFWAIKLQF